jgi:hypothetical protein
MIAERDKYQRHPFITDQVQQNAVLPNLGINDLGHLRGFLGDT